MNMSQKEKQTLLLKDLSMRLPHYVKIKFYSMEYPYGSGPVILTVQLFKDRWKNIHDVKPYLRTLSSMTKKEALKLAELRGFKNILSVKVNQYHIVVEVDDGVCSSERHIIWFNEIVSSIGILDWLLKNHFDFRGLIELGLALPAPEGMYK